MSLFRNIEEASVDSLNLEWDSLEVSKLLLDAIKKEFKFSKMTPVQAASIPLMLKNKDVIVEAKTGSGKTLAFVIPIIESLLKIDAASSIDPRDVLAIILSPTRELATQIHQELRKLLRNTLMSNGRKLVSQIIVGGNTVTADIQKYTKYGGNIIVATPGRLSTIMEMTDNNLNSCIRRKLSFLIFDEADHLLSFGFERNISSILAYLPKQRRTSLFSATQTTEVEELVKSGMRNPISVNVNKLDNIKNSKTHDCDTNRKLLMPDELKNYFHVCESYAHKLTILTELIKRGEHKKMLVFFSTCSQVDYFSQYLEEALRERRILKLHRRLKNKRKSIFKAFKTSKRCVLLVTDILSRGIDVPDISCVVHLDLPASPECFVHRSGRSGHHIESSGISLLLLEKHELDYIEMCRRRQISLHPMNMKHLNAEPTVAETKAMIDKIRSKASKDENYLTLGIQAFVSYIRYYSSKLCLKELLFPKLPKVQLAKSFGLTRLPKMPELRKNYKLLAAEFSGEQIDSCERPNGQVT